MKIRFPAADTIAIVMLINRAQPDSANDYQSNSATLILNSHQRLTGQALLPNVKPGAAAHALYHAPCVVLAHDTAPEPLFFYANRMAQQVFEMDWETLVRLPSRHSAEPLAQDERQRLLARVSRHGYIRDYSGIRISSSGKRFLIEQASVWNLLDAAGGCIGQAAAFSHWRMLP